MIIYKVTNLQNGKIYVGQTIKALEIRKKEHLKNYKTEKKLSSPYFYYSINKYGEDNFKWDIIDMADSQEELNNKEKYWIREFNSLVPNGYNMTEGGQFGRIYGEAEERRQKNSKETKIELYGIKVININTKEIYKTIVEASKVNNVTPTAISLCCNGINKKAGKYTYAFLEDYENNKEYYDSYVWENSFNVKLINLSNNKIYNSLLEAEQETGISYQGISKCCRNIQRSAGGYFWAYYNKYINDKEYKNLCDNNMNNYIKQEKKVINLDTMEIFNNIAEAGRKYNVDSSAIIRVCKGKQKTSVGYHWSYVS